MRFFRIISFFVLLMSTVWQGCGIYSFTGASYGTAKTVSVDYFQNRSSYVNPTLSQKITEDLKDRFMSQTPLNLVKSGGDLSFEGTITGYQISAVDIKSSGQAASNRLTISIKVSFTNSTEPDNDFDKSYSRYADYDVKQPFATVESTLVEEIVTLLIDDIFNDSVVNW
ncbi:MAG: LptE family protein [Bacteroidales bacterium]|nr:LptE family protein [Bacteroidales bacterium]MBR4213887.1 LptE family protein [Bacteroidales bacterium]